MDRVRELGDASVPFRFDTHALVFSDDAVGLETRLHHEFADRRVNLVNVRREFFRASPAEVRDVLARHQSLNHPMDRRARSTRMAAKRNSTPRPCHQCSRQARIPCFDHVT